MVSKNVEKNLEELIEIKKGEHYHNATPVVKMAINSAIRYLNSYIKRDRKMNESLHKAYEDIQIFS